MLCYDMIFPKNNLKNYNVCFVLTSKQPNESFVQLKGQPFWNITRNIEPWIVSNGFYVAPF